jgi:hypothetical protein
MDIAELRAALDRAWNREAKHVERLTVAAAVLQVALRQAGMEATLVGGGAIEFYAPRFYTTTDIDFVVERGSRESIDQVFTALGLTKSGRHWSKGDLYVEVPGNRQYEPVDEFTVGPMTLRVVRKEYVLSDRIVGFRHWKYWAYGNQAMDMIAAFGDEIDDTALRAYLRREGAEDTYDLLRLAAASDRRMDDRELESLWRQHYD